MPRALTVCAALALAGCAVDASGFGPPRADAGRASDLGPLGERDAQPVDSFVPGTDSGPVDSFVPPPDMCTASAEICNGADDDCNGTIDDGLSSVACDGDGDGCMDGLSGCSGGSPTCSDAAPTAGMACDGPDFGASADGALTCVANALVCEGDCTPAAETCDRTDENCDGLIDDGGACNRDGITCKSQANAGRVYLFCGGDGGRSRDDALTYCEELGYDLVRLSDTTEAMFVAMHLEGRVHWTRANVPSSEPEERRDRAAWRWSEGDAIDTSLWSPSEPSGNGSCGQIRPGDGLLDDAECPNTNAFICEGAAVP